MCQFIAEELELVFMGVFVLAAAHQIVAVQYLLSDKQTLSLALDLVHLTQDLDSLVADIVFVFFTVLLQLALLALELVELQLQVLLQVSELVLLASKLGLVVIKFERWAGIGL